MAGWNDPNGPYSQNQQMADRQAEAERRRQEETHQRNHANLVGQARGGSWTSTPTSRNGARRQRQSAEASPDLRTPEERATSFENGLAMLIMLAVWGGVSWAGIAEASKSGAADRPEWYVFVIIGFVAGAAAAWALMHPFRPVLVLLRRLIVFTCWAGLVAGLLYVGYLIVGQQPQPGGQAVEQTETGAP